VHAYSDDAAILDDCRLCLRNRALGLRQRIPHRISQSEHKQRGIGGDGRQNEVDAKVERPTDGAFFEETPFTQTHCSQ
jgi:hypothetical protein